MPSADPATRHRVIATHLEECYVYARSLPSCPTNYADVRELEMYAAAWKAHDAGATWVEIGQAVGLSPGWVSSVTKGLRNRGAI